MKVFYGWVIVAVGMVVTCVGFGAMFSLGVFLQPMAADMGWSRTAISNRATFWSPRTGLRNCSISASPNCSLQIRRSAPSLRPRRRCGR